MSAPSKFLRFVPSQTVGTSTRPGAITKTASIPSRGMIDSANRRGTIKSQTLGTWPERTCDLVSKSYGQPFAKRYATLADTLSYLQTELPRAVGEPEFETLTPEAQAMVKSAFQNLINHHSKMKRQIEDSALQADCTLTHDGLDMATYNAAISATDPDAPYIQGILKQGVDSLSGVLTVTDEWSYPQTETLAGPGRGVPSGITVNDVATLAALREVMAARNYEA